MKAKKVLEIFILNILIFFLCVKQKLSTTADYDEREQSFPKFSFETYYSPFRMEK